MKASEPKTAPNTKAEAEANPKPRILATLKYTSPSDLRTNYLTGLTASSTPDAQINVVGYVERKGFPERATVTALPEGGGILEEAGGGGWIREIQSSFIISVASAENLVSILQEAIKDLKSRQSNAVQVKEKIG